MTVDTECDAMQKVHQPLGWDVSCLLFYFLFFIARKSDINQEAGWIRKSDILCTMYVHDAE